MIENDLITIILPVYNGEQFIAESINSCLNQTYSNIELVIVNDCSTDNTLEIIQSFEKQDSRIRIINNIINLKLPASLNVGHKAANGLFLSWTSDDNLYKKNAIEELVVFLKNKDSDFVYSNFSTIDLSGKTKRKVLYKNKEDLLFGNSVGSCFLYKKEVFIRNKGFNESLFLVEDYDFWLRASLHSLFCHLDKDLYKYRLHDKSLTNSIHTDKVKNALWKKNITEMYSGFVNSITTNENEVISQFQTDILTYQNIEFSWIKNHFSTIKSFVDKINHFSNYSNKSKVETVFLRQIVHVFISSKSTKGNIKKSFFIIKKYFRIMDFNTFKTLMKYSFFK
ncbi:glycosyltransferase [Olleya namhaensis]|uniref:glycosyltransferase n=1 Tax=Olleya namhaensis TaxID=1144750 RepID=UPI0024929902|nr:glycosyltransferase [Olleya namhaensis]